MNPGRKIKKGRRGDGQTRQAPMLLHIILGYARRDLDQDDHVDLKDDPTLESYGSIPENGCSFPNETEVHRSS
jgi:hypothetical protein